MAKLSLNARKNIKEYEAKLQENLKKIETASGILFELDIDWLTLDAAAEKAGYKDRIGEMIYSSYLGGLADNVTVFCQDPIQKEAFVETFGTKKRITFELYDHVKGDPGYYNRTRNDNGTLVLGSNKPNFIYNVAELGKDLSTSCSGGSELSVATRKNIKDYEAARTENLASIKNSVGLEFSIDIDWVPFAKASADAGYADRVGEMIYHSYLGGLAWNLKSLCADEMSKEAVAEACEKKTIHFVLAPAGTSGYGACTFDDGVLTVSLPVKNFCSNVAELGKDIASRL